jgi:ubiquinone/menaquinone biosynthesis C-methylase UbiE
MEKTKNKKIYKDDISSAKSFDEFWQSRFEELGKKNVPAYLKASYPTEEIFKLRETFIRHLVKDSLCNIIPSEKRIPFCLDVGCNAGLYTKMLHDYQMNVCGVDIAESLIREAKITYPFIDFIHADAHYLPFKNSSFDFVVSFGLLQCVSDWRKAIQEISRILRPGGTAMVTTNRIFIFPLAEKLIRNAGWLIKGKMGFKQLSEKLRPLSKQSSPSYPPAKYRIKDIIEFLIKLGVEKITIHDPAKFWIFHNFLWGITFTKMDNKNASLYPAKVKDCPLCRRSRKWKLK